MTIEVPPNLQLEGDYARTLSAFAEGAGEAALVEAYGLGRRAVAMKLSLLDFALLHHRAAETLASRRPDVCWSVSAEFFTEALSPYELTLRAYHENARLLGLGEALTQQNAETERAHQQLRTILNATTAAIYLRSDDLRFLFVNRRFEELFGVEQQRILGTTGEGVLDPQVEQTLRAGDQRAIDLGTALELEETFKLGTDRAVYLSLKVPLVDDDGSPYAICSVASDISERKRAEEAIQHAKRQTDEANEILRATQAQLVQSAKMASLGELVAGIAHEINNPLAFALSHLSTARKKLARLEPVVLDGIGTTDRSDWSVVQERLMELNQGLERIAALVLRLRTFSRLDEGELQRANVREAVESALTILRHRLASGVVVRNLVPEGELLDCFPALVNQALLNLLANAIDAVSGEGEIVIETRHLRSSYEIRVRDNGAGIPDELRERIFEPFFTTKPVGEGTGLGLSITYSIMRQHGGRLSLEAPAPKGTEVVLSFPTSVDT